MFLNYLRDEIINRNLYVLLELSYVIEIVSVEGSNSDENLYLVVNDRYSRF